MTRDATPAPAPEGAPPHGLLEDGIAAFVARDVVAAHAAFERAHRKDPRDARAMSWYGVTLVLVEKNSNLGVTLCDQALRVTGPEPELLLNQARVHLALNQRERAVRPVMRGLELWPGDPRLQAARDAIGTRRPPVIGFLSRNNPLNRLLGRIRYKWARRHTPFYEMSPLALGFPPAPAAAAAPAPAALVPAPEPVSEPAPAALPEPVPEAAPDPVAEAAPAPPADDAAPPEAAAPAASASAEAEAPAAPDDAPREVDR